MKPKEGSFITTQRFHVSVIPAYSCLTQTIQSKTTHLSQQDLLSKAYTSRILDINQSYLSYSFYQELTQEYLSFFTLFPQSNPCTLDILLPLCTNISKIACIFLSETKNYFCFYQDSILVFCKEFQEDPSTCIKHIQIFFSYKIENLYCLSHKEQISKMESNIIPLLSLFDASLGFQLSSISSPITLHHFQNINPQRKKSIAQTTLLGIAFGFCLIVFLLVSLGLILYQSHLENLNQTNTHILPISINELKRMDIENQNLLNSLFEFSILETQKLVILEQLFPYLKPQNITSIKLNHSSIVIHLQNSQDLTMLLSFINSLGYRCKTFKEGERLILEISKHESY